MKKKCRVYKKPVMQSGGEGFVTQDSGSQPIPQNRVSAFMESIKENQVAYESDEQDADQIEIIKALSRENPLFKERGDQVIKGLKKNMTRKGTVGKLTELSGGKITSEGIQEGLQSEDPEIRKRAEYARNAQIISEAQFGGSVPQLQMAQGGTEVEDVEETAKGTKVGVTKRDDLIDNSATADAYKSVYESQRKAAHNNMRTGANTLINQGLQAFTAPTRYQVGKGEMERLKEEGVDKINLESYTPGMGGKHAYLNYNQTPEFIDDPSLDPMNATYIQEDEEDIVIEDVTPDIQSQQGTNPGITSTYREPNRVQVPGATRMHTTWKDPSLAENQISNITESGYIPGFRDGGEFENTVGYLNSLYEMRDGGTLKKAQAGYQPTEPQPDDQYTPDLGVHNQEESYASQPLAKMYGIPNILPTAPADPMEDEVNTENNFAGTTNIPQDPSRIRLDKVGKLKNFYSSVAPINADAEAILAAENVASGFLRNRESVKNEQAYRREISDPFNKYKVRDEDRGDYYNGILKPDEHTRMGYGTKMAQQGFEVGSELELTDEEIQELIAQGYELDFS